MSISIDSSSFLEGQQQADAESKEIKLLDDYSFLQEVLLENIKSCQTSPIREQIKLCGYIKKAIELKQMGEAGRLSLFYAETKQTFKPTALLADEIYRLKTLIRLYIGCFDKDSKIFDESIYKDLVSIFDKQNEFINSLGKKKQTLSPLPVAIIGTARSGSSLLGSYFQSIAGAFYLHEILNYKNRKGLQIKIWSRENAKTHILKCYTGFNKHIVVGKFLDYQLRAARIELEDFSELLPKTKFLFIYRKNLLAQFVSEEIAAKTKQYAWTGEVFDQKIQLCKEKFKKFCENKKRFYDELFKSSVLSKQNCAIINYEELAENPQEIFRRSVFPLLNIEPSFVKTEVVAQKKGGLENIISNYKEFSKELAGDFPSLDY